MSDQSKIEWTDSTWNPWEGCQKVGPGCDHCYAEARNSRFGGGSAPNWGPGAPRRKTSPANWNKPRKWNRDADRFEATHGRRQRVFCASLADLFDNAVDLSWTTGALMMMEICDRLQWLPLTKRVGNVADRIPEHWKVHGWPPHIGLMITVVNQEEADRDIPKLLALKAKFNIPWVGISYEPALGALDLTSIQVPGGSHRTFDALTGLMDNGVALYDSGLDWVIAGGESGPNARPAHPGWIRSTRDQCEAAGVAFLHKQWGEFTIADDDELPEQFGPNCDNFRTICQNGLVGELSLETAFLHNHQRYPGCFPNGPDGDASCNPLIVRRVGKKRAGRLLDGIEHNGFPEALR